MKIGQIIRSRGGMSILEVMVAAGLLGVVSLQVMQVTKNMTKSTKTHAQQNEFNQIQSQIQSLLRDEYSCEATLLGLSPTGGGTNVTQVKREGISGSTTVVFETGKVYGSSTSPIFLKKMAIKNYNSSSGIGEFYIEMNKGRKDFDSMTQSEKDTILATSYGTAVIGRSIKMNLVLDGSGKIKDCVSDKDDYTSGACGMLAGDWGDKVNCKSISVQGNGSSPSITAETNLHVKSGLNVGSALSGDPGDGNAAFNNNVTVKNDATITSGKLIFNDGDVRLNPVATGHLYVESKTGGATADLTVGTSSGNRTVISSNKMSVNTTGTAPSTSGPSGPACSTHTTQGSCTGGCSWTSTPGPSCSTYTSSSACTSAAGCSWTSGPACSTRTGPTGCSNLAGCSWAPSSACINFPNPTSCNDRPPCRWTTGCVGPTGSGSDIAPGVCSGTPTSGTCSGTPPASSSGTCSGTPSSGSSGTSALTSSLEVFGNTTLTGSGSTTVTLRVGISDIQYNGTNLVLRKPTGGVVQYADGSTIEEVASQGFVNAQLGKALTGDSATLSTILSNLGALVSGTPIQAISASVCGMYTNMTWNGTGCVDNRTSNCTGNQMMKGFNSGAINCQNAVAVNQSCAAGEIWNGVDASGNKVCVTAETQIGTYVANKIADVAADNAANATCAAKGGWFDKGSGGGRGVCRWSETTPGIETKSCYCGTYNDFGSPWEKTDHGDCACGGCCAWAVTKKTHLTWSRPTQKTRDCSCTLSSDGSSCTGDNCGSWN